ncbi:MAG: GNAT family acetyltransferase [Clostridium sp.]|nr:GNAT family acetyltransferase [Clostridium sp.]MCM1172764.1 GNAT family acetyltransferase [Clostridium sp.]
MREYLGNENPRIGEERLAQILSNFSCPKNLDVERFLKQNSIEFTKKSQSVTYLVFSTADFKLLAYFTIALKSLTVRSETVSNTTKKKLLRVSELDEKSDTYTMSAYLIAQLGKNYTDGINSKITGKDLVELAWAVIEEMQYMGGGMVTFLEAENEEKLLSFYHDNRFSQFDTRQTVSGADESHELV